MQDKYTNVDLENEDHRYYYNQGVMDYVLGLPQEKPQGFLGAPLGVVERLSYTVGYLDAKDGEVQTDIDKTLIEEYEGYGPDTQKRIDALM